MTLPKTRRCECDRCVSARLCACYNLSRIAARISHTLLLLLLLLLLAANRFGLAAGSRRRYQLDRPEQPGK